MQTIQLRTKSRCEFVEITRQVQDMVSRARMDAGAVIIYVPHTTAACTINENADPDVVRDILSELTRIVPYESDYKHGEGNSAAHIKACLFGSSQYVIVQDARLVLGTWQGIYFCEFDGPRERTAYIQFLREHP